MFEEILQYPVENIAQKFAYNKDMPYYSTTEQAVINPIEQAYAGASAFVSSALMGGAGSAVNTAFDKLGSRQKDVALIIGEELDKTYKNIEDGTQATEQDFDNIIVLLKGLEENNPELKEYLQGHVKIVDDLKMKVAEDYVSRQTKDINQVEQTLEQDTNVPQIEDKSVTEDIKEIDNIIPIESLKPQELLQDSNNIVTETQQMMNVTNVTEEEAKRKSKGKTETRI